MSDIFIVGAPRSGTSWLRTLLASHPDLASPHELHLFDRWLAPLDLAWQEENADLDRRLAAGLSSAAGLVSLIDRRELRAWMGELVARARRGALAGRPGATRMLEKTPAHARQLELIRAVVPGARFVHLVRDPRAVVASMLEKSRRPFGEWAPDDVLRATALWRSHVGAALRDGLVEDTLVVRYEDLRADPTDALRRIAAFLALPGSVEDWLVVDPALRAHARAADVTVTRSLDEPHIAAPPVDAARAAALRDEIGAPTTRPLSASAVWYVESRCREEMAALGYGPERFIAGRRQPLLALTAALELRGRRLLAGRSPRRKKRRRRE